MQFLCLFFLIIIKKKKKTNNEEDEDEETKIKALDLAAGEVAEQNPNPNFPRICHF
jgi:hypothetical protein